MMTAEQLKVSLYLLLFSGKLTEQLADDGTAIELLNRIEKKHLASKKALRIIKKESGEYYEVAGTKETCISDELLFDIPDNWTWIHLNEIAVSGLGKTLNKSKDTGDTKQYLCSINVYWDGIHLDEIKEAKFSQSDIEKYKLMKGDLLICEGGDAGRTAIWEYENEMYYQNALHRVRFWEGIDPYYFRALMEFYKLNGTIDSYCKGMTIKHLVQGSLNAMRFPLPPLAEQKRIVAKIEELMPIVEQYAAASTKLNTLNATFPEMMKKSILQEAVQGKLVPQDPNDEPASVLLEKIAEEKKRLIKEGKIKKGKYDYCVEHRKEGTFCVTHKGMTPIDEMIFDLPDNWTFCTLSELVQFIGGYAYKSNLFVENSPYQVLRLGNVKNDSLKLDVNPVYITENLAKETQEFLVRHNDVLLTMTGTRLKRDYFYTVCVDDSDNCLFVNQRVGCLRPYCGEMSKWLSYVLKSNYVLDFIFNYETGTANQGNLGAENIMKIIIPLPPINEQKRIVKMLDELTTINKDLLVGPLC